VAHLSCGGVVAGNQRAFLAYSAVPTSLAVVWWREIRRRFCPPIRTACAAQGRFAIMPLLRSGPAAQKRLLISRHHSCVGGLRWVPLLHLLLLGCALAQLTVLGD
jgi:hypothetical protein